MRQLRSRSRRTLLKNQKRRIKHEWNNPKIKNKNRERMKLYRNVLFRVMLWELIQKLHVKKSNLSLTSLKNSLSCLTISYRKTCHTYFLRTSGKKVGVFLQWNRKWKKQPRKQCCGSGSGRIRAFWVTRIREKNLRIRIRILHPQ